VIVEKAVNHDVRDGKQGYFKKAFIVSVVPVVVEISALSPCSPCSPWSITEVFK
jgi:hypothetical protein